MQRMQKIELPKEIGEIINAIETKEFEAYVVGGSVRDLLLGYEPFDWEISTNAPLSELTAIFPDAKIINQEHEVIRIEAKDVTCDINIEITGDIENDLKRKDFTVNAIAYNPKKGFVDPFDGRNDIVNRLITATDDPLIRFTEDPIRMMRAMRLAADTGFDLHIQTYRAIHEKHTLIENVSIDEIRAEFEKVIVARCAGKGLKTLAGTELRQYTIGDLSRTMTRKEFRKFEILADRIDKTERTKNIRLGLFYSCFDKIAASAACERMGFDPQTMAMVDDAIYKLEEIDLFEDKFAFKQFIASIGLSRYKYLDELSRAQRVLYNLHDKEILERKRMMEEIEANNEPIFLEDLKIDENDIVNSEIAKGEKACELMEMLLKLVHKYPERNTKEELLTFARNYANQMN